MSSEKRFLCLVFLFLYVIFTILQGITIVLPVDWTTVDRVEVNGDMVEIKFGTSGSANFHAYYKIKIAEENCVDIKPYYFLSPLFRRGLWSGSFTVTLDTNNINSIKLVDNYGGEIDIPIPEANPI